MLFKAPLRALFRKLQVNEKAMAKQTGEHVFIGTINGICFYGMNGKYYARASNPLSRKQVLTDAAFAGTRRYAQWLAAASPIASAIYRRLPAEKRQNGLYRTLTGKALLLLKAGLKGEEVSLLLTNEMEMPATVTQPATTSPVCKKQVYNNRTGTPLPAWPGLRMIKAAAVKNRRLRRTRTGNGQRKRIQTSIQPPLFLNTRAKRRHPNGFALINSAVTTSLPVAKEQAGIFGKTLNADESTVNTLRKKTRSSNIIGLHSHYSHILLVE